MQRINVVEAHQKSIKLSSDQLNAGGMVRESETRTHKCTDVMKCKDIFSELK